MPWCDMLEGEKETEIVRLLLRLRSMLSQERGKELSPQAEAARAEVINVVNNFFYEKLTGIPRSKPISIPWQRNINQPSRMTIGNKDCRGQQAGSRSQPLCLKS